MKKLSKLTAMAAMVIGLLATTNVAMAAEPYGSTGALIDDSYSLEEMLTYAIQDEYAAEAEYDAIMDSFGVSRPYATIIKAEEQHVMELVQLFESYGITVPTNDAASRVVLPVSLQESYAIGVEAEVKNIEMYEIFLAQELPADVKTVFENLMAGSENHLKAFENAVARETGLGQGNGTNLNKMINKGGSMGYGRSLR